MLVHVYYKIKYLIAMKFSSCKLHSQLETAENHKTYINLTRRIINGSLSKIYTNFNLLVGFVWNIN